MAEVEWITDIDRVEGLSKDEKERLKAVTDKFPFRSNSYYLSLIDWSDPDDPIRRIVVPITDELESWGKKDPSHEASYTVLPGLQHKYIPTALVLSSEICGGFCRFCFRKRLFMEDRVEWLQDVDGLIDYVSAHPEITNVILSGGDALMLSNRRLEELLRRLSEVESVKIIRIATKLPAYNPYRIIDSPELMEMIKKYAEKKQIYFVIHFNHPKEMTEQAVKAVKLCFKTGAQVYNQTPMIRGVNDDPEVLNDLFRKLSFIGVTPYYVFQIRPTVGNKPYVVPIEEAFEIFDRARSVCSGLAKTATYAMSHATGKIEVIGLDERYVYMRYHQAADTGNYCRLMKFVRNPQAYWFDDYLTGDQVPAHP